MSYSFPYALGICLATVALLAACTWLAVLIFQEVPAWLARRDEARRKREAREAAAWQEALACLDRLRKLYEEAPPPVIPADMIKRGAACFNEREAARLARAASFNVRNS